MKTYNIEIRRLIRESTTYKIEADSIESAKYKATLERCNIDESLWETYDCEYYAIDHYDVGIVSS